MNKNDMNRINNDNKAIFNNSEDRIIGYICNEKLFETNILETENICHDIINNIVNKIVNNRT